MKLGVVFPQTEIGPDPGAVREFAQAAEELGYDHLLAYDHVLGADTATAPDWPGPYTRRAPVPRDLRPLRLPRRGRARARARHRRARPARSGRRRSSPSRRPRSTCSPAGGSGSASGSAGTTSSSRRSARTSANRGRRVEEQIEVLRRLWTEPVVDFDGRWHRIPRGRDQPAPRAAADPDLDRRLRRGGDPADRAARGRLLPAAAARGRLAGDDGALPRLGRGGRPRPGADRDRVADRRLRGHAGRLARARRRSGGRSARRTCRVATMRGGLDVDGHIARIRRGVRSAGVDSRRCRRRGAEARISARRSRPPTRPRATRSSSASGVLDGKVVAEAVVQIPLRMMNRHGLIAGATGTGKTKGLQAIAEQLSDAGVPVFAADMKGDLSGLSEPGGAGGDRRRPLEGARRDVRAEGVPGRVPRGRRDRPRHPGARDRVRLRAAAARQGAAGERDAGAEPLARSSATPTRRGCRSSTSPTCARCSPSSAPRRARRS